ncbi:MAG: alanine racemase [Woeseiaceae bacterium]|nr:alanine racemase [Woeseiaceae bacterium]
MTLSRRQFVTAAAGLPLVASIPASATAASGALAIDRFDPWLEIETQALRDNVSVVSELAGERPILAVIKNNAYGLGLTTVASILEPLPQIAGFAVVKAESAMALRDAGIRKPVLLMALFGDDDGEALLRRDVTLSISTDDSASRIVRAAKKTGRTPHAHIYLDTGMSRMGIPYHRALPVLRDLHGSGIRIEGTFTGFTEDSDFDREQLARFIDVTRKARDAGVTLGALHAASSHAVFNYADAHLDQVRPGIALFGAYPSDFSKERKIATLTPAVRLKARIVRVERLRKGDSVSYGRHYIAAKNTWIATVPAGHTDGVPRNAVNGARVLVNGVTYPVIGAVSASHTIIEIGDDKQVDIGDIVTLLGPDDAAIHPNQVAESTGTSVYDRLMHLNPNLPKVIV